MLGVVGLEVAADARCRKAGAGFLVSGPAQVNAGRTIESRGHGDVAPLERVLALRSQAPMIDASHDLGAGQGAVRMLRPFPPPVFDDAAVVLRAVLAGEAVGIDAAGRQEHVRMRVSGADIVAGHVGDHAAADVLLGDEAAHEVALRAGLELLRQRNDDLAGHLGVLARLGRLDLVPEAAAVLHPRRRVVGGEDLRVVHGPAARVVVDLAGALVSSA